MLRVAVVIVCFAAALARLDESLLSDESKNIMANNHQICVGRTGVDEDLIKRVNEGQFADDRNLKCYAKCLLVEGGVMDETSGDFNYDSMKRLFSGEVLDKLKDTFSTCSDRADKNDMCQRAYDMFKCNYNLNEDLFFMA